MNSRHLALSVLLVAGGGAWWWSRGSPPSDEDLIRALVEAAAEGARNGEMGALMEPVSRDYHDDDGLDFQAIRAQVFLEIRRHGHIGVALGPVEVDVEGDRATARLTALLTDWRPGDALVPTDADAWVLELDLRREAEGWRIVSHRRSTASGR